MPYTVPWDNTKAIGHKEVLLYDLALALLSQLKSGPLGY